MFDTVLVANRGEIAARIISVLKARGIRSIAIYSDADEDAEHVRRADAAYRVGPSPVGQSYLNQDAIFEAVKASGAQAIHPGYGLLSENAHFARRCEVEGVCFIGPSAATIDQMGDKVRARTVAHEANVHIVPGSDGPIANDEDAAKVADAIGYPVLVKAAGGGGGIGMALVKKPSKLQRALTSCRDRGASSFGNPSIYLEKFIENPRHIEVQVLFDHHGHGVHLFERECSLQRRHQKVIEEAPSPFLAQHPTVREAMCDAAVRLAAAVGYRNAGTVEFVVGPDGSFYFIEMNTRLQVEHPVTESITGIDLIGWQLDIAAGRPLTVHQSDISIRGAAVECRLYAEDPEMQFIPKPGRLGAFSCPDSPGIRLDAGVHADQEVTPYYDPMIAKLIAHGADRTEALTRATHALDAMVIENLVTNRSFLGKVLQHPDVVSGQFDTAWLEKFAKGKL
ncbi:MAG: biotin carboxylase N-terminal domain-containing protein [Myxococcota bacterium]|nr:biotin carboxylase N-terminal domain-containing protein [Myxococcota bacterium]